MQGGACPTMPGPLYPTWTISIPPPPQFRHISYLPDFPLLGSGTGSVLIGSLFVHRFLEIHRFLTFHNVKVHMF